MTGTIIKGIGGFYYVYAEDGEIYSCKAKGGFRRQKITPLVGDEVEFTPLHGEEITGGLDEILPRKNSLIRPAIANVEVILVVFAAKTPDPDFNLLDRFLLRMESEGVECIIVVNKSDLASQEELDLFKEELKGSNYRVIFSSTKTKLGQDEILDAIKDKRAAVAGPSGVGKSSLINNICPENKMETGELSEKIARGKHTTRHAELLPVMDNTFIFDTPGFSSADIPMVEKEELRDLYPEYVKLEPGCRFSLCLHENEPDCAIKDAVSEGAISQGRHQRYIGFLTEVKNRSKY